MALVAKKLKIREIVETLEILNDHLYVKTIRNILRTDNSCDRVISLKERLALLNHNPEKNFRRFVAADETWLQYKTLVIKEQVSSDKSV